MAHPADRHDLCGVIDGVENPIVPDAHPQAAWCALHTLHAERSGGFSSFLKAGLDTSEDVPR